MKMFIFDFDEKNINKEVMENAKKRSALRKEHIGIILLIAAIVCFALYFATY